jgi:hypothetical protein
MRTAGVPRKVDSEAVRRCVSSPLRSNLVRPYAIVAFLVIRSNSREFTRWLAIGSRLTTV